MKTRKATIDDATRLYAVTGDHSRLVYSRHRTHDLAKAACRKLARKWGPSHPGAEPRVVCVPLHDVHATHIQGGVAFAGDARLSFGA